MTKKDKKDVNSSDDQYQKDPNQSPQQQRLTKTNQEIHVVQHRSALKQYRQFFDDLNREINYSQANSINQLQTKITSQTQSQKFFQYINHLQKGLLQQLEANQFIVAKSSSLILSQKDNPKIDFQFKILRHIPSFQVVQLFCKLGKFSKTFTVFNNFYDLSSQKKVINKNPLKSDKQKVHKRRKDIPFYKYSQKLRPQGSYSNIYNLQFLRQKYLLKCVSFKGSQKLPFHVILKQIFIAFMMSALRIGPKIKRINGFDFCVNSDCVQFSMQQCKNLDKVSLKDEQDLKICLLKMHSLKLCHIDIKPQNIMYSPKYKKAVLIDFGISQLLQKGVGNKTMTHYNGTRQFSSPQMSELFTDSFGPVDLYLNDIYGLKLSIKKINQQVLCLQSSQISNKQNNYELNVQKRSYLELISKQSQIISQETMTDKLLYNELIKRVFQTFREVKNQQQNQNLTEFQSYFYQQQSSQRLNSRRLSLPNQLLAQLTKCLIYKFRVDYMCNYSGQDITINDFSDFIEKIHSLQSIGDEINYFGKLLSKQFLEQVQKYYIKTQPSLFYYNFFNREKALQIRNFYNESTQDTQKNIKQFQKSSNNHQPQKLTVNQQLNILLDENKIKYEFFSNNNKQIYFVNILIQHLKFANSKGTTIVDKLSIVQNIKNNNFQEFIQIYLNKTQQNCELFKYFLGLSSSLTKNMNQQCVNTFSVNIPFLHQKNKRLLPVFQIYQRMINILLYSEKIRQKTFQFQTSKKMNHDHFNQSNLSFKYFSQTSKEIQQNMSQEDNKNLKILNSSSSLDQDLIKQLIFHLPDIIKNTVILGFNYFDWLKSLVMALLRSIIQRKNIRKHFTLVCLKQFLQIGVICDNFHTFVEEKQIQPQSTINLKYDLFNKQVFKDLMQSLKKTLKTYCLDDQLLMRKIQIIPNLWIFFNYQLVKFTLNSNQLIDIFSQFVSSLNKQFLQLSSEWQFEYYPLYKQVMQSIKDYSLIKYIKVFGDYWRHSVFIVGADQTYKNLWNLDKNIFLSKSKQKESNLINEKIQRNTKKSNDLNQEKSKIVSFPPPALNYYIFTDPIHYDNVKQPIRHKIAQKSFVPIDIHFISIELTHYLHLPIRAQFWLNNKSYKYFEWILIKLCDQKMNNFHDIKTILRFVDLLVDLIKNSIELIDIKLNECLRLLWIQCLKIINLVKVRSFESQDIFQLQYIHLTYVQILQKIHLLFTLMISKNNNPNILQMSKYQVLANFDLIINIMYSYQSNHLENINIKIFNGYMQHKLISLITKRYPQLQFFNKTRIILILSNILTDFIQINRKKKVTGQLEQKKATQIIQDQLISKELWGLLLHIIFIQILPLVTVSNYQNSISLIKNPYREGQHFTTNQEQLSIHSTINILKNCLVYNFDNLQEFWKVFLHYLKVFICSQKDLLTIPLLRSQDLHQRLISETFAIFLLFSKSINQNMKSQILQNLFQLIKDKNQNNLRLLSYIFILIQQKAYHCMQKIEQKQEGLKNLKNICSILFKKNPKNEIRQYLEQYYLNHILLNLVIKKQKSSKLHFLVKKLILNLQQQSLYDRNSVKYVIYQYLYDGLKQKNLKQRKYSFKQQINFMHFSQRLKYFNTMIETKNKQEKAFMKQNQKVVIQRCKNFLQNMNNKITEALLSQLQNKITETNNRNKQKMLIPSIDTQNRTQRVYEKEHNKSEDQFPVKNKQLEQNQKHSNIKTELTKKLEIIRNNLSYDFQIPKDNKLLYVKKLTYYILSQILCL